MTETSLRLGRFRVARAEPVKIPEFVLRSSAFVVSVASEGPGGVECDLEGSGFFVAVASKAFPSQSFFYFVTANHVLSGIKTKPAIRINQRDGKPAVVETEKWYTHPTDPNADVAITRFLNHPEFDILFITDNFLRVREALRTEDIGIGDEVFFPGLFAFTQGEDQKNHPIVRQGNVAMIPTAPIPSGSGFMDAYLIEARSIGGLSGSPVYVRRTMSLIWNDDAAGKTIKALHGMTGEIHVLGMIQGHWDIKESQINQPRLRYDEKGVNMGIAIVIPADKILETLHQPELVALREQEEQIFMGQNAPTMD